MTTLGPNYVRKIAESYRLLRDNAEADLEVLRVVNRAAKRCIAAHMRAELALDKDVRLPLGTVLMMLQYVERATDERLTPVPEPQDFEPSTSPELQPLLVRAAKRLQQLVAA